MPRAPLPSLGVTHTRATFNVASVDVTPPSSLIQAHAPVLPPLPSFLSYEDSLCRLLPTPAGLRTFPTLSLQSLCRRLDPYPAVFLRCPYPFLHGRLRPHVTGNTFGTQNNPYNATSIGRLFSGLQSFDHLQAPTLARPPDRTHRSTHYWAARPFTPRIARLVTHSGMWYRYVPDMGNWHGWTFTSWIAALSAAPSRTSLFST